MKLAAVAIIYGIAFILVPDFVLVTYGVTANAALDLMARYFGLTLLGQGVVVWLIKDAVDGKVLRGFLSGFALQSAIGLLVSIWGTLGGILNALGWSAVLIYALLLAGYLYYLFADRAVLGRAWRLHRAPFLSSLPDLIRQSMRPASRHGPPGQARW